MSILIKILEDLNKEGKSKYNIKEIEEIINDIDAKQLYLSKFHGLYHSEKVSFFAYLIAINQGLNDLDKEILLDAAKYHDVGRLGDSEDTMHGLASTNKLQFLKVKDIYQDPINEKLLKAIIEGHSLGDHKKRIVFDNYELDEQYYSRYEQLYNILKDADALDRMRFAKTMSCVLNESFLRIPYSKKLVELSEYINEQYKSYIDKANQERIVSELANNEEKTFYHSIGYNIFAIPSILKRGIISNQHDKSGLFHIKEHAGNNNGCWISAIYKKGSAFDTFAKNKFVFCFQSQNYHLGIPSQSMAQDLGLPFQSGKYDDEIFIYDKVKPEQLKSLLINKNLYESSFKDLYLMNGNISYEKVKNRLGYYLNILKNFTGIDYSDKFREDLEQLYNQTIIFENKMRSEQMQIFKLFLEAQEKIVHKINAILINLFYSALTVLLNKEDIRVKDVFAYIMHINNIDYQIKVGDYISITFNNPQMTLK